MFHHHVFLSIVYACVIVVLYKVDIEVMSRPGFKCRAAFVAQGVYISLYLYIITAFTLGGPYE